MESVESHGSKIGLVLSGGAARSLAHVGVIDVLHKEGVPIDMIAGTSGGAIMGAVYAWNRDTEQMIIHATDPSWKGMAPMIDPSFPRSGFIKGRKIKNLLASFLGGNIRFSDLKIPFACIATDIDTGEEIIIDSGSVPEALRASISVPGIFTPVKREGRYLVDGGLTTPVPVDVVRNMGADFVIAVNVNPEVAERKGKGNKKRAAARKVPNLFQILIQTIYITTYSLARTGMVNADVVIEPYLSDIGAAEFQKAGEMIERGQQAAMAAIPEIKRQAGLT